MEPVFSPNPPVPWHKKPGTIVILFLLTLIVIGVFGFIGLVGYYSFKIHKGEGAEVLQNISGFTKAKELEGLEDKPLTAADILAVISLQNPMKGKENAPITVTAFIDFQCPFSQSSHDIFNLMMKQYSGSVKVVFKHFPIDSINPQAANAALAAACAQEQQKFWEYYDALFSQESLTNDTYLALAEKLNLHINKFNTCFSSKKYLPQIEQDLKDGITLGVKGTPTYFINAKKIEGVPSLEQWNTLLLKEIKK